MAIANQKINKSQSEAFISIRKIIQEKMKEKGYEYNRCKMTIQKK